MAQKDKPKRKRYKDVDPMSESGIQSVDVDLERLIPGLKKTSTYPNAIWESAKAIAKSPGVWLTTGGGTAAAGAVGALAGVTSGDPATVALSGGVVALGVGIGTVSKLVRGTGVFMKLKDIKEGRVEAEKNVGVVEKALAITGRNAPKIMEAKLAAIEKVVGRPRRDRDAQRVHTIR